MEAQTNYKSKMALIDECIPKCCSKPVDTADIVRDQDVSPPVILTTMDHLEVLREKIARLRSEIADIQELNEQYRFRGQKGAEADIAHSQRQERLQAIQEELVQLSQLGHKTLSIEQMREKHRSRLHLVKNAS